MQRHKFLRNTPGSLASPGLTAGPWEMSPVSGELFRSTQVKLMNQQQNSSALRSLALGVRALDSGASCRHQTVLDAASC